MKRLIEYFVDRSFTVNLLVVAIGFFGIFAFFDLPRDLIPAFDFKRIRVHARLPGASAIDLEKMVTFPVEESLRDLPGLETIRSYTRAGSAWVHLKFRAGHKDIQGSVEQVRALIDGLKAKTLPEDIEEITINQIRVDSVNFLSLSVMGVNETDANHREWMKSVEEKMRRIEGIVKVESGLRPLRVFIHFDSKKLAEIGVTLSEVRRTLMDHLTFKPVGELKIGGERISVEMKKDLEGVSFLKSLPISSNRSGKMVKLSQIAEIKYDLPERETLRLVNGEKYIYLNLFKDPGTDSISLREKVKEVIGRYEKVLPEGIQIRLLGDGPKFIEQQLRVLRNNAFLGLVLVLVLLSLFLGGKTSLMAALGIPIAYLGTLVVFQQLGIAIDLISVIGMILIIGILVDDAIIVSERYVHHLEEGLPKREAAVKAAHSLIVPVTGTILTTVVAFSPILLVESEISHMLFAVPIVVIAGLALSWFESFFILPNHLKHFVGEEKKRPLGDRFFRKAQGFYERILNGALRFRYLVIVGLVLLSGATYQLAKEKIPTNFRFRIGSERLNIYAILKSSDSLEETKEKLQPIHDYLNSLPQDKVELIGTRVGRIWMEGKEKEGPRYARIRLYFSDLTSSRNRATSEDDLKKKIEQKLKSLKTDSFEVLKIDRRMAGKEEEENEASIAIHVLGDERLSVAQLTEEVRKRVGDLPHTEVTHLDEDLFQTKWKFVVNDSFLSQYGIQPTDLAEQLGEQIEKKELGFLQMNGERIQVYSQIGSEATLPQQFEDLKKMTVLNERGIEVPLQFLGSWIRLKELKEIRHRDAHRAVEVKIKFNPKEWIFPKLMEEIQARVQPLRFQYPAYRFQVGDADEGAASNRAWAAKAVVLCFGLILLVLALCLGSVSQPLLVGLAIPFGLIGIIWALYFHGAELGVMTVIGMLGTAGVAVNGSLIMVHSINLIRKGKKITRELIVRGASGRLRAVFLTTVTTLGGLFPMAYGLGGESGFTAPLALAMGWGLAFATLLTLIVLPLLLQVRVDLGEVSYRIFRRISRKTPSMVFPRPVILKKKTFLGKKQPFRPKGKPPSSSHESEQQR